MDRNKHERIRDRYECRDELEKCFMAEEVLNLVTKKEQRCMIPI